MAEKNIGGIWQKQGSNGTYLSGSIEIDGVKHLFVAFPNSYKQQGDTKPDFQIFPPKGGTPKQPQKPPEKPIPATDLDDEIPF